MGEAKECGGREGEGGVFWDQCFVPRIIFKICPASKNVPIVCLASKVYPSHIKVKVKGQTIICTFASLAFVF